MALFLEKTMQVALSVAAIGADHTDLLRRIRGNELKHLIYLISICNREHVFQAAAYLLITLIVLCALVLLDDLDPSRY